MKAIAFIILQIFSATRAVLKSGEYHSDIPQFYLGPIQLCDALRQTVRERRYLMDYKSNFTMLYKYAKLTRYFTVCTNIYRQLLHTDRGGKL